MGISSLFGGKKDESVDSLFSKNAGPVARPLQLRTILGGEKRKRGKREVKEESKRDQDEEKEVNEEEDADKEDLENKEEENEDQQDEEEESDLPRKKARVEDENPDLEEKYFAKLMKEPEQPEQPEAPVEKERVEKVRKARNIDFKEDELTKAERTVFVGNVSNEAIKSRKVHQAFKKLFGEFGAVESVRYRSISFDEALPRKIAFTRKSLHESRDTVNAYVVFKDKESSKKSLKLNATVFENNHIRVDHVAHPAPKDNKRTIFVGNLDFEEKEETLWKYFNAHTDGDVESVRVVRDPKTNMGKGFALVQFKDTLSVNKALFLNDKAISKEKKRKLRITRAKSYVRPSAFSPNYSNKLTDLQRTKLGRAKSILGRADRATAGKVVIEGQRAAKGQRIAGMKSGGRVKKPRHVKEPKN